MRSAAFLILALFAVSATPVWADDNQTAEYVVVPGDAWLHTRPDKTGDKARIMAPGQRAESLKLAYVARWVGERDGWIEIAPVSSSLHSEHCAGFANGLDAMELRFFVRKTDLLEVTTKVASHTYPDGTSIRMAAGIPLYRGKAGRYHFDVHGIRGETELPKDSIGDRYRPERLQVRGEYRMALARKVRPRLGGTALTLDADMRLSEVEGDRAKRVLLMSECREVWALVPAGELEQAKERKNLGSGVLGVLGAADQNRHVRQGAPVYDRKGNRIGSTWHSVSLRPTAGAAGKRVCEDRPLKQGSGYGMLKLCYDNADINEGEPPILGGLTGDSEESQRSGFGFGGSAWPGSASPGKARPAPKVSEDQADLVVDGGLDAAIVRRIMRRHLGRVRICYERALASNPKAAGRVVLRFTIGANGAITAITHESSELAAVGECMVQRFRSAEFPRPDNGRPVQVTYPYRLQPVAAE